MTTRQWTCSSAQKHNTVQQWVQDIAAAKQPGSSLVVMDVEASFGFEQLWEVSGVELTSGETLINATVNHPEGIVHKSSSIPGLEAMSRAHAKRIYQKNRSDIHHMDVPEIVAQLAEKEINSDTIVLVWATNKSDLEILRTFVQSGGYNANI